MKHEQPEAEGSIKKAAKAIGAAAGKLAHIAGVHAEPAPAPAKTARLQKKDKQRLPRKLKKAAAKKAAPAHA